METLTRTDGPKIITLDIETSPNLALVFDLFQQNISLGQLLETTRVICVAYKWHHEAEVGFLAEWIDEPRMLDRLHELLDEQAEVARETLQHVSGKVQLNLRVSYVEEQVLAEVVREQPRVAELRERTRELPEGAVHRDLVELGELVSAALEAKSAADAEVVLEAVQRHEVELVERAGGGLDHVVDLALLVPEERLEAFEQMLEEQAEATHGRLRWRLVGPVAPYDFAGGVSWD